MRAGADAGASRRPRFWVMAAVLLVLQSCASMAGKVVLVDERDSGRTTDLKAGEVLEIRLMTYPARGLTLSLGSDVRPTLILEGSPSHNDDMIQGGLSGTGTGSYESWRFRAVQPGQVNVRMNYRLQWETTGTPTRSVDFAISVQ